MKTGIRIIYYITVITSASFIKVMKRKSQFLLYLADVEDEKSEFVKEI